MHDWIRDSCMIVIAVAFLVSGFAIFAMLLDIRASLSWVEKYREEQVAKEKPARKPIDIPSVIAWDNAEKEVLRSENKGLIAEVARLRAELAIAKNYIHSAIARPDTRAGIPMVSRGNFATPSAYGPDVSQIVASMDCRWVTHRNNVKSVAI